MEVRPDERRFEELKKELLELKDSREKLLAEKFHLVSQTQVAVKDNEKLTDSNVTLEGRINDLKLDIEHLRGEVEAGRIATQLYESRIKDLKAENKHLKDEVEASHHATQLFQGGVKLLESDRKHLGEEVEVVLNSTQLTESKVNGVGLDNERLREEVEAALKATQLSESRFNDLKLENERLKEELEASHNATQLSEGRVQLLKSDNKCLGEEVETALNAAKLSESKFNDMKLDNERLREEVEAAHNARQLAEKKLIDKLRETRDQGSTIKELATQCGTVMGHQNHSQKIKYMVKLKSENVELKTKVTRLETELATAKRNPARPITARSNHGAQNIENAAPILSSTASRKNAANATAKVTLKPNGKSATANSQARIAPGVGSRRAIVKK